MEDIDVEICEHGIDCIKKVSSELELSIQKAIYEWMKNHNITYEEEVT